MRNPNEKFDPDMRDVCKYCIDESFGGCGPHPFNVCYAPISDQEKEMAQKLGFWKYVQWLGWEWGSKGMRKCHGSEQCPNFVRKEPVSAD